MGSKWPSWQIWAWISHQITLLKQLGLQKLRPWVFRLPHSQNVWWNSAFPRELGRGFSLPSLRSRFIRSSQLHENLILAESHLIKVELFPTAPSQRWQAQWGDFSLSWAHYRVRATPALCIHLCSEPFTKSSSLFPVPGEKTLHLSARRSLFDQPETWCLTANTSLPAASCNLHYFPGLISFVFCPQVLSFTKQHCKLGQFTLCWSPLDRFAAPVSLSTFFF